MTAERIAVVSAVRTPIGRYMGGFSTLPAPELGVWAAKGVLEAAQVDPADVGVAYFGQGRQAGSKPNPARQVTWGAGLPQECTATTVNIACASGMKSLQLAADDLRLGRASVAMVTSQQPPRPTATSKQTRTGTKYPIEGIPPHSDIWHPASAD